VITRVDWPERAPRSNWQIHYTPLGAAAQEEKIEGLEDDELLSLTRLRSQCMIALTPPTLLPAEDSLFLAAIVLKLMQRGSLPRLPGALERAFAPNFLPLQIKGNYLKQISLGIPKPTDQFVLDSNFALHDVLEKPFWKRVGSSHPETTKWLTPQASLESLAKLNNSSTRWVDFVYYSPFSQKTAAVLEIQGSQHAAQKAVDRSRAIDLKRSGLHVVAESDINILASQIDRMPQLENRIHRTHDSHVEESLFLPSALARFTTALALLLQSGHMEPNTRVNIQLESEYETVLRSGKYVFEFLRSIEKLWNLNALPAEVSINGELVHISKTSTEIKHGRELRILLQQHTPPHAELEIPTIPTCVIRGAFLPVDLTFLPPALPKPRTLNVEPESTDLTLRELLRDIFDHDDFRPNQLEAIKAGLSGLDSIILLPTGSGKSLIYQMVGLLQPGVTLVVDPITSLIDDQVRSLSEIGIERTFGLHSGLGATKSELEEFQTSIAQGQAIFVFISPERLQTVRFRETLTELAGKTYINSAVLDEAHCISEWGHDFRTAYLNVAKNLRKLCCHGDFVPSILALTGTASPAVLRDMKREIQSESSALAEIRPESHDRPNLHYLIEVAKNGAEYKALDKVLGEILPESIGEDASEFLKPDGPVTNSGIIFTATVNGLYKSAVTIKEHVEEFAQRLLVVPSGWGNHLVDIYASTVPKGEDSRTWTQMKRKNARRFIENEIPVLVATKSFGMGIDKPNIRWTIHFGFPSSLEAFAQESGRSGRDGKDAYCVLITNPATTEDARKLLDLTIKSEDRKRAYLPLQFNKNDLVAQMYFHLNSFKGRLSEYLRCIEVLKALRSSATSLADLSMTTIDIPDNLLRGIRLPILKDEDWGFGKEAVEGAIYRLNAIGVVDDYLVNFGSKSFTVKLGPCSNVHIDSALLSSMKRMAPGKSADVEAQIASAPENFDDRVEHHLKIFIETLYDTIEPARIRAITEMQQLASSGLDGMQVKARLNAYLSNGPLATAIEEIAESSQLDVAELTTLLDTVDTQDSDIWIGASARQLETYPDNPILLSSRVIGEGWRTEPDMDIIESALNTAFSVLDQYQLDTDQASLLLNWITGKFDQQNEKSITSKYDALALAWQRNELPNAPLVEWESEILNRALKTKNPAWLKQVSRIRERRIQFTIKSLTTELERLSS